MKIKEVTIKVSILFSSISLSILLCEGISRVVLNSADYLSPTMIRDEILGITIAPSSSGFDEWGFRNKRVPSTADIVAVGDSHTYGNTATMDDAWPSVVARETGREVYNLGLGGYGPNQYSFVLKTKGFKLRPKWVLCGLYFGDDFENAFSITYGLDHWSFLRNKASWENVDPDIWNPGPPVWAASLRNWLSSHSMIYRLVVHGPFVTAVKEYIGFRQVSQENDPYTTALIADDKHIREAFRPLGVAESLNQASPAVREGLRITLHLLKEMNAACGLEGCRFLVVIIPTKETVFSEYINKNPRLHLYEALNRVILNEQSAREALFNFLSHEGIEYLDTLGALRQSVGKQLYAQTTRDMHPGKNGYRVIGETVAEYLKRSSSSAVGTDSPVEYHQLEQRRIMKR